MRIVFLDLDGVMNSGWYFRDRRESTIVNRGTQFKDIDPYAINVLNEFCNDTDAKVVISSSWRSTAYDDELLKKCGFTGEVIDTTPHLNSKFTVRGNEIYAWIKFNEQLLGVDNYHQFKQYVIFDDDSDMLYQQKDHFFLTTFECGLTDSIAYRAKRFLLSQNNL